MAGNQAPSEISMTRDVLPSMTDTRAGRTTKASIGVGKGEAGVSGGCAMEEGVSIRNARSEGREDDRVVVCGLSQETT